MLVEKPPNVALTTIMRIVIILLMIKVSIDNIDIDRPMG